VRKANRKSIYLLSAAAAALLVGGSATAMSAYKTVTLEVDGKQQEIAGFTFGTVGELLEEQGVQVKEKDLVQPVVTAELAEGTNIRVQHAKSIQIQDGTKELITLSTQSKTVEELLKEANITVNEADKVSLDMASALESGQTVTITRRTEEVKVAEEAIPFQTERQPDGESFKGTEKVLTPGVEGKTKITTKIFYENGKEVDRKEERAVAQAPVNQVVGYGTKERPVVVASRGGSFTASKTLTMAASAYSMPGSRTATGTAAGPGTVAVDPNVIPLGTKLYIEGYGHAVASDTGGAIKGNRIDLHFATEEQARQFGRRVVKVYVVQ